MCLFNRIIGLCNSLVQFMVDVCPRTQTKALDDDASTIDWSNCAHSSIRRVLSLSTSFWSGKLSPAEHSRCSILPNKPESETNLMRQFIRKYIIIRQQRQVEQFHVVVDVVSGSWNVLEEADVLRWWRHHSVEDSYNSQLQQLKGNQCDGSRRMYYYSTTTTTVDYRLPNSYR